MAFPNWYEIGQITRDNRTSGASSRGEIVAIPRRRRHQARPPRESHKLRWLLAITVILFVSASAMYSVNPEPVGGTATHKSSMPSPTAPSPLTNPTPVVLANPTTVSIGSVGTTFTIQVKVQNMPQFNGWDIRVYTAPWVINATSLSITGNTFQANATSGTEIELIHCVNGAGTGCTSSDTAGWVHSSYGNTGIVTGNGLLFTITYQIVGNNATSPAYFGYSPISLLNVLISSPSGGTGIQTTVISGTYGSFPQLGTGGGCGARVPLRD